MLRKTLAIALIALIASACSSSRQVTAVHEASGLKFQDSRDSVKVEKVVVEVHDTVMETTTIVVDRNEAGDTLRLEKVTDRDRVRNMTDVRNRNVEVKIERDTVFIEKRDSVDVKTTNCTNETNGRASPVVLTIKWVFWIIIAIIALIFTIKVSRIIRI